MKINELSKKESNAKDKLITLLFNDKENEEDNYDDFYVNVIIKTKDKEFLLDIIDKITNPECKK